MRLDRGLRSASFMQNATGYSAPPTDEFNLEEPQLQMGGIKDQGIWIDEQDYPTNIELCVRMTPIWLDNKPASAKLDNYAACQIYPSRSVFFRVKVETAGIGYFQKTSGGEKLSFVGERFLDYELDLPKPHLYQKDFLIQPDHQSIHWRTEVQQNPFALWAYGGQQVGDDIHPFVFTLESFREQTSLKASSLPSWRERGVVPKIVGQTEHASSAIQDIFTIDQTRTLKESIEAGMSVIHLKVGTDDSGIVVKVPYHSFRFAKNYISYKRGE